MRAMRSRGRGLAAALLIGVGLRLLQCAGQHLAFTNGAGRLRAEPDPLKRTITKREDLENVDVAVACMLLGSIAFVMGLFYLVNHSDQDIRRYSWEVISTTIAIFTSVLIFQGMDGIVVSLLLSYAVPKGSSYRQLLIIFVSLLHFLTWFVAMHCVVAKLARGKSAKLGKEDEEATEGRERQIKCWATLLSHMTAFAGIAAVCDVQQLPAFAGSATASAVPVAMHVLVLFATFRLTDYIRNVYFSSEGGLREQIKMWDEEGEEAENDLAAISLSFLVVQVLRFRISGSSGDVKSHETIALAGIAALVAMSLLFLAALFALTRFLALTRNKTRKTFADDEVPTFHAWEGFDPICRYMRRWSYIILDTSGMCFAWCLLYATKWAVHRESRRLEIPLATTETISGILLALSTSVMACLMIFGINWICDHHAVHDVMMKQFRSIIRSLGILIGFAWEQSFDAGVEAVAKLAEPQGLWPPLITKLFLACVVGLVVVPAWRHHILKTVLALRGH